MLIYSGIRGAAIWSLLTVAACALTLLSNTIYLGNTATPRFLLEKGYWASNPWWLTAFYFHVVGASVCLFAGTPLMFPALTRRYPAWHRRLGYVYFNAVLWMAAPSGLVLSVVAKGGAWSTAGFAIAAWLWWYTTWTGYIAIRRGAIAEHVEAMVRSYCLALSAPIFRAFQLILFCGGVEDTPNYVLSLWLSVAASILLAEFYLVRQRHKAAGLLPARLVPQSGVSS